MAPDHAKGDLRRGAIEVEPSALHQRHPKRYPEPWAAFAAGLPHVTHGFTRDEARHKLEALLAAQLEGRT